MPKVGDIIAEVIIWFSVYTHQPFAAPTAGNFFFTGEPVRWVVGSLCPVTRTAAIYSEVIRVVFMYESITTNSTIRYNNNVPVKNMGEKSTLKIFLKKCQRKVTLQTI